jgi:hypothetical protein
MLVFEQLLIFFEAFCSIDVDFAVVYVYSMDNFLLYHSEMLKRHFGMLKWASSKG